MKSWRTRSYAHFISTYHAVDIPEQSHPDTLTQLLKENIYRFLGVPVQINPSDVHDFPEEPLPYAAVHQALQLAEDSDSDAFPPQVQQQISIVSQEINRLLELMSVELP